MSNNHIDVEQAIYSKLEIIRILSNKVMSIKNNIYIIRLQIENKKVINKDLINELKEYNFQIELNTLESDLLKIENYIPKMYDTIKKHIQEVKALNLVSNYDIDKYIKDLPLE